MIDIISLIYFRFSLNSQDKKEVHVNRVYKSNDVKTKKFHHWLRRHYYDFHFLARFLEVVTRKIFNKNQNHVFEPQNLRLCCHCKSLLPSKAHSKFK